MIDYNRKLTNERETQVTSPVIHLQFGAYESWDSLFHISMSPTANL